jgi:hypothetical protein
MGYIGNSYLQQQTQPATDFFSGTGSTTTFTLSRPVSSAYSIQVMVNNVQQSPYNAFTINASNQLVLSGPPPPGTNNVYVVYSSLVNTVGAPAAGTVNNAQLGNITNINAVGSNLNLQTNNTTQLYVNQTNGGTFVNGINVNGTSGSWPNSNYTSATLTAASAGWVRIARLGSGNGLTYGGDNRSQAEITIQTYGGNYSPGTVRVRISTTWSGFATTNLEIAGDDMYAIRNIFGFRVTNPSDGYTYLEAYVNSTTTGGQIYISDTVNFNVSLIQAPQPAGSGTVMYGPTPIDSVQSYRYSWNGLLNVNRQGNVSIPQQPAAWGYLTSSTSNTASRTQLAITADATQGGVSVSSNVITVPTAGRYWFYIRTAVLQSSGSTEHDLYWYKNGADYSRYQGWASANSNLTWMNFSNGAIFNMAAGDTMQWYQNGGPYYGGSYWTGWTMYMLG